MLNNKQFEKINENHYELRINLNGNKRGRKAKVITQEQENWLFDVLERSDMTYTNPGRKDHV